MALDKTAFGGGKLFQMNMTKKAGPENGLKQIMGQNRTDSRSVFVCFCGAF